MEILEPMVFLDFDGRREKIFTAWDLLSEFELLPFHKLLTGGVSNGVSKGNLCKALAKFGEVEPSLIAQKLAGDWNPKDIKFKDIFDSGDQEGRLCQPYPFCLAHPLQEDVKSLGNVNDWQVEWKWDGIRAQLITWQVRQ